MLDYDSQYINFFSLEPSLLTCFLVSAIFVFISNFRPQWMLAIICVQPYLLWIVSCNIGFAFYPAYALAITTAIKFNSKVLRAATTRQYNGIIFLCMIIVMWAILSPLIYPIRDGFHAGWTISRERVIEIFLPILFLPILVHTRYQLNHFISALIKTLIISHFIIFLFALAFVTSGESISSLWKMRILGITSVYWESGLLLICLIYLYISRKISFSLGFIFSIIAVLGLAIGGSRSRIIATLLSSAYFILPYLSRKAVGVIAVLTIILSTFTILPSSFKESIFSRITERIAQSSDSDLREATSGRSDLYLEAYERWKESPIIGVGSGYAVRPILINGEPVRRSPHSFFIELLACQGIVGIFLLLTIFVKLLKKISFLNKSVTYLSDLRSEERLIIALIIYGITNWAFKAHWGIAFSAITLLACFDRIVKHEIRYYKTLSTT